MLHDKHIVSDYQYAKYEEKLLSTIKLLVIMKEKKSQCDRILKIQSLRISHKKRSGKNKWLQTFQFLNHSFIHPFLLCTCPKF